MRALVVAGPSVEVAERPDPTPARGEVVVRVSACGICGSDVHAVSDQFFPDGQVLGHEISAVIAAVGSAAGPWVEGQPVAVNPIGSCGQCAACRRQLPFLCKLIPNVGISAAGGFAEYLAVPAAQLVALPADLDPWVGSRAEPLAVALRAVELAGLQGGEDVAVFGVGSIGLNVIIALRLAGAGRVVGVGRSPGRRAAAADVGADLVVDGSQTSLTDFAREHDLSFAATFECAGSEDALDQCVQVLEPGGTCVQVSLPSEPVPVPARQLTAFGQRIVGSCAFVASNYAAAVEHLTAGRVPIASLVSARVSMDEAPEMFQRLLSPGQLVGVLVEPWR